MSPVRFWDLLSDPERAELTRSSRSRQYPPGQRVFSETEDDGCTAIITSGRCRVVAYGEDGTGTYLALRQTGDIIGEMAAIRGGRRSATVTAVTLVVAQVLARTTFQKLLGAHPALTAHLLAVMIERLRESDRCQADLAVASTELRFSRVLLRLALAEGVRTGRGVELAGFTQLELAGWCGISRKSVERHARRLQEEGVLLPNRSRGRLVITDLDALRGSARQESS
ncbi:Crp/Fnr family transcriptional regulator [Streptomyces sp. PTM05]|uniref:Crp/Fnr family transcriptional regulator n=1 Tax=Streptantibioticus parmotrematis TaxID=2873249 RepID=A0ABS7QZG9_9ACTN|nr:Crp/Fnr family transcriptional regulator [Streptantibioticus parmotrematis]MBY8888609.1 Crp/Fnr family transcriptional regulator [Streptantibioticus parmotrematis]